MNVDSKQFNRNVPLYEEVEQNIRNAQRLRSQAIANSLQRLGKAIDAGVRRVRGAIAQALHAHGEKGGVHHFGWSPVASVAGRPAPCK